MFDDLKNDTLESELCSQAAEVSAGECRLVLLIGEFDRRGAWSGAGLRSCAHWLNWRVGTSLGAAREQVRVGRALNGLSCLRAAFQSGERTTRRHLHAHHVVFWSKGGRTALSNLVTLCGAHHRFVHEGGWDLHLERCGALRVVSPQGEELPAVPSRSPVQGDGLVELGPGDRAGRDPLGEDPGDV